MNQRGKNAALIVIAGLLLLVAGRRFWSMAVAARNHTELNRYSSHIQDRIVSHVGLQRPDPFADLNLTAEQRRQIDDIMPKMPPPNHGGSDQGGPGKPHFFRFRLPIDKIRKVLTAEQLQKFDRRQQEMMKRGPIGGGSPGSSAPFIIHQGQGEPPSSPPPMRMMLHGPDEGPH